MVRFVKNALTRLYECVRIRRVVARTATYQYHSSFNNLSKRQLAILTLGLIILASSMLACAIFAQPNSQDARNMVRRTLRPTFTPLGTPNLDNIGTATFTPRPTFTLGPGTAPPVVLANTPRPTFTPINQSAQVVPTPTPQELPTATAVVVANTQEPSVVDNPTFTPEATSTPPAPTETPTSPAANDQPASNSPLPTPTPSNTVAPTETSVPTNTPLPDADTATPAPTETPSLSDQPATDTPVPEATATPIPEASATPVPEATNTPESTESGTSFLADFEHDGWGFSHMRSFYNEDFEALFIYGRLTNKTGTAVEMDDITGHFLDKAGNIASEIDGSDLGFYTLLPPDAYTPFWVSSSELQTITNFELQVETFEPEAVDVRDNFTAVNENRLPDEDGNYCVTGQLQDEAGEQLGDINVIITLYDGNNKVINFDFPDLEDPEAGAVLTIEKICVEAFGVEVSYHEFQAWEEIYE